MVKGPRQSGKSTLVTHIARALNAAYVSLDDPDQRAAAVSEPTRFANSGSGRLMVIDEVQRGGEELLLAIKAAIDRDDRRGQFLLTGSANYLMLPTISESLQGRIAISTLFPYSRGEIDETPAGSFIDSAFDDPESLSRVAHTPTRVDDYWELICSGGYPEIQTRGPDFRNGWFNQLIETTISREISDLGNISNQDAVAQVLSHCAALSSKELNVQSFVRAVGVARQTVNQYLGWLSAAHLVQMIPAWRRSLAQRQIKTQKVLLTDSGLACHLCGKDAYALARGSDVYRGQALETFVGTELIKQLGWTKTNARLFHWRTVQQAEVDFVIESTDGRVIGIEVKSSTSPGQKSGRWLAKLRDEVDRSGGTFVHGYVLHLGEQRFPLGDRLSALPVDTLWSAHSNRRVTSLNLTSRDEVVHSVAIDKLGERPATAAVSFHLRPRNPRRQFEFTQSAKELQNVYSKISGASAATREFLKTHRDFMSYRVTDFDFEHREFTRGRLNLDGSATWLTPISTFGVGKALEQQEANYSITATELVFAVAIGLKALTEWASTYCGVRGNSAISVQFHSPPNGVRLATLEPRVVPCNPGVRGVDSDLPPIAIEVNLDDWHRDPSGILLGARYFSEHLLAAFGYEGVKQIDRSGRIDPTGIEKELLGEISRWTERMGIA